MNRAIAELLQHSGGVICRRRYPELAGQIDTLCRSGVLVAVLPGTYAHRDVARHWRTLARAVSEWDDRSVIVGEAAAALTFWPELRPTGVQVAGRRAAFRRPRIEVTRRSIPPELVTTVGGARIASPALTALDLVPRHGGDAIDRALRSRMATLPGMHRALGMTGYRDGNAERRRMLLDSRDEPWSGGERLAHQLLREAGITGWHANVKIVCDGYTFYQDILVDHTPVVVEVDGRIHLRPDIFESDRRRGNYLLLAGRQVLHFTWLMLTQEPAWFVETTRRAIDLCA